MVQQVSNVKVLQKAKMQSIDTLLALSQLRWSGHLERMYDNRLPKQLFYSQLSEGYRQRGRQTLRFKDTLKSRSRIAASTRLTEELLLQTDVSGDNARGRE
jgi:hypothetical protein